MREKFQPGKCSENMEYIRMVKFSAPFAITNCSSSLLKPGGLLIKEVVEAPPYPGARLNFLIEEKLDNKEWLSELIRITVKELPEPKPKKKKKK